MEVIRSLQNARVKSWCKLHEKKYRDKEHRFLIENEHLIMEAKDSGLLEVLILLENESDHLNFEGPLFYVSEEVMKKLKMSQSLPKWMGVCRISKTDRPLGNKIILCDDVQDPGNLGTMIRSAYAFGFDSFIVSQASADLYNDKTVRSTQGALFHMNVCRGDIMDVVASLRSDGYKIYATALKNAKGLSEFKNEEKMVLIFGNEGRGVREELLAMADACIYIEMNRFESLNVAMAATICCYWFRS